MYDLHVITNFHNLVIVVNTNLPDIEIKFFLRLRYQDIIILQKLVITM